MIRKCNICGSHFVGGGELVSHGIRIAACSKECLEAAYALIHVQIEAAQQRKAA